MKILVREALGIMTVKPTSLQSGQLVASGVVKDSWRNQQKGPIRGDVAFANLI